MNTEGKPSSQRKRFEEDTFPHLEALRRTARWLTMHGSLAESLVQKCMEKSYSNWHDLDDSVSSKALLFRVLTNVHFGFGRQDDYWSQSGQSLSETKMPTNAYSRLPLPNMSSEVSVKGAIARLEPHSRLLLILLYSEQFSYADIAYITDLPIGSVKTIFSRLRKLIPGHVLEATFHMKHATVVHPVVGGEHGKNVLERRNLSCKLPLTSPEEPRGDAASERWENEGGTIDNRSKR